MRLLKKLTITDSNKQILILGQELEKERVINHFALTLMDKRTVDEVVEDITENCITHLNFLDCVVYRVDEKQQVLILLNIYNRKLIEKQSSFYPQQIPLGKGMVGSAALSGKAEVVKDTSKETRYSSPNHERLSEIIVPINWNGKVVGVIYASHPQKNFFKHTHLKILTHIALLMAIKVKNIKKEKAYRQAKQQLLKRQRRMSEIKLQLLQMQLNPHFMFNSLTSINYFILQQHTDPASRLLTKFSRWMRQVLENAKSDWVSLRTEWHALRLFVELEQMRCANKFETNFHISEGMNPDNIQIPPFILQSYVQQAIWHKILPAKEENMILDINCYQEQNTFVLKISDNITGKKAFPSENSESSSEQRTQGMNMMQEYVRLINNLYKANVSVKINDGSDEYRKPVGTIVTFIMKPPLYI